MAFDCIGFLSRCAINVTEYNAPGTVSASSGASKAPLPSPDDPRVFKALEEFSAALNAGKRPDRHEYQTRYPEVATAELAECLEGLEFVRAAAPLCDGMFGEGRRPLLGSLPMSITRGAPSAITASCAKLAGAAWASSTRRCRSRWAAGWPSRCCPSRRRSTPSTCSGSRTRSQAAAQLHHTNIVPVFGVGCERGVHYYAMQFIDGHTLGGHDRRSSAALRLGR